MDNHLHRISSRFPYLIDICAHVAKKKQQNIGKLIDAASENILHARTFIRTQNKRRLMQSSNCWSHCDFRYIFFSFCDENQIETIAKRFAADLFRCFCASF